MRLIQFEAPNGSPAYINPEHVTFALSHGWENGVKPTTELRTAAGNLIVKGDMHEVVKRLLKGDT